MLGIAKYPIDKWIEAGQSMISTKGWIKLCANVAAKGLGQPGQGDDLVPEAGGKTLSYNGVP
eukprot:9738617-Prorocentrum_lima.AAC.1